MNENKHTANTETILKRLVKESRNIAKKEGYMQKILLLKEDVRKKEYQNNTKIWLNGAGIAVVDSIFDDPINYRGTVYVKTEYKNEFSWLIFRLKDIYEYDSNSKYALFGLIAFLLNKFQNECKDLNIILKQTITLSVLYLHPNHMQDLIFYTEEV